MSPINEPKKTPEEWMMAADKALNDVLESIDNLKFSFAIFTDIIKNRITLQAKVQG